MIGIVQILLQMDVILPLLLLQNDRFCGQSNSNDKIVTSLEHAIIILCVLLYDRHSTNFATDGRDVYILVILPLLLLQNDCFCGTAAIILLRETTALPALPLFFCTPVDFPVT